MRLTKKALLTLYDHRHRWPEELGSPVSAITGMVGEDLVLGLLARHLKERDGLSPEIIYKCKGSGNRGHRLDAWVITQNIAYQVEVKNWCATAMGGRDVGDSVEDLRNVAEANLQHYLGGQSKPEVVWKVLEPMVLPKGIEKRRIQPLLAFWSPVSPPQFKKGQMPAMFDCPIQTFRREIKRAGVQSTFTTVSVFSASLYLRDLDSETVRIAMPRAEQRLKLLGKIFTGD